jgi:soluble lytic murein transglycosylase-like protein
VRELIPYLLVLLGGGVFAIFRLTRPETRSSAGPTPAAEIPFWDLPPAAELYRSTIAAAEGRNGIPPGLLGRLLYQESRFRPDVINGATKSSAGAVGIAQIVPRWHPDVDPTNPFASIDYAASYLAGLKSQFGTWERALAAYNWGPGNLGQALAAGKYPATAPTETKNYVAQITRDVRGLS